MKKEISEITIISLTETPKKIIPNLAEISVQSVVRETSKKKRRMFNDDVREYTDISHEKLNNCYTCIL